MHMQTSIVWLCGLGLVLLRSTAADEVMDVNDYEDDSNVTVKPDNNNNNNNVVKRNRTRSLEFIPRLGTTYMWDKWDKWTKCAHSCVQIKRRPCLVRTQRNATEVAQVEAFYPTTSLETGCKGVLKKLRLCKDEKCQLGNSLRLRDAQCQKLSHNNITWIGHISEPDECQLFCRSANDTQITLNLNQTVLDGTACLRPAVYYTHSYAQKAVCFEGICRAVHYSGLIRPTTTEDSKLRCGSLLCKQVSEIYRETNLQTNSLNLITEIPMGAMNISIKPLTTTENLLVLKAPNGVYILNEPNRASKSGIYEYDGSIINYNEEDSHITAKGPLKRAVQLLLFIRGANPGIFYEYTLPIPSASVSEEEDMQLQWNELGEIVEELDNNSKESHMRLREKHRKKFSWKLLGFGQCSRTCGPGVQQAIFRCIRESPTRYYTPKRCAHLEKPTFSADIYKCNRGLCPAYWRVTEESTKCNCKPGSGLGIKQLRVECVQELITGVVELVNGNLCAGKEQPKNTETCKCQVTRNHARSTPKYASFTGAVTVMRAPVNASQPLRRILRNEREDKAGVWLMSNWTAQCDSCAATRLEYRSIYCDRTSPYTDLCDLRYTPQQKRICQTGHSACEHGTWLVSEWSNCTGDCFNLQRQRIVACFYEGKLVDDIYCEEHEMKPITVKNCTQNEVDFCGAQWHYSEWSECSRTCGEGTQRRYAKCLDYDWHQNTLVESTKCAYKEREPVFGTCNVQMCEELNALLENAQRSIIAATTTTMAPCSDDFSNCKRINRRLCKLQYYKIYCCQTCQNYL